MYFKAIFISAIVLLFASSSEQTDSLAPLLTPLSSFAFEIQSLGGNIQQLIVFLRPIMDSFVHHPVHHSVFVFLTGTFQTAFDQGYKALLGIYSILESLTAIPQIIDDLTVASNALITAGEFINNTPILATHIGLVNEDLNLKSNIFNRLNSIIGYGETIVGFIAGVSGVPELIDAGQALGSIANVVEALILE